MSALDRVKIALPEIIKSARGGKVQLPDFARSWAWDDSLQSRQVSIGRSFPAGAVRPWKTGGDARFQARPVENVTFAGQIELAGAPDGLA